MKKVLVLDKDCEDGCRVVWTPLLLPLNVPCRALPYPSIPYINPDDLKGLDDPQDDDETLTTLMALNYPSIPYITLARVST